MVQDREKNVYEKVIEHIKFSKNMYKLCSFSIFINFLMFLNIHLFKSKGSNIWDRPQNLGVYFKSILRVLETPYNTEYFILIKKSGHF